MAKESAAVKGLKDSVVFYAMMRKISTALFKGVVEVLTGRVYGLMCPRESKFQQAPAEMADGLLWESHHPLIFNIEEGDGGIK